MLTILQYDKTGQLKINIDGDEYTYFGVSPYFQEKAVSAAKYQNRGRFFKTMRGFQFIKKSKTQAVQKQEQLKFF